MNYKKIIKKQRGLSLIEIMVAFSILAVAFIALAQSFPFGLSINKSAESSTVASYLAQGKIEELTSLGYDNVGVGAIEEKHRLSDNPMSYLYNYQSQTDTNYVDGNLDNSVGDQGIKKISVIIYYINSISKVEDSYNIITIISRR